MDAQKFALRFFPSLSDFAFLAPMILLFSVMGGTRAMLTDCDTGWHLRTGDWILQNGRVPHADPFSFTKAGEPWFAWEWLWDVAFAWIHSSSGMAGVILASVLVLCFTFLLLYRLVRRQCANDLISFGVVVLAVVGASVHFLPRPHLFTLLFSVILFDLLERVRRTGRGLFYLAPLLVVLWVNVHAGFVAGIIIAGAYAAGELAGAALSSKTEARRFALRRFYRYGLVTAACAVAALFNPYGYHLYSHIYAYLSDPYLIKHVAEYQVVNFSTPPGRGFQAMLILGAMSLLTRIRHMEFAHVFLYLAWAHLALTSQRHIPLFMMMVAPSAAMWLEEAVGALARSPVAEWARRAAVGVQSFAGEFSEQDRMPRFHLLSVAACLVLFALLRSPAPPAPFRAVYDSAVFPEAALSAVRQLGSARLFATDTWGSYLIYRLYPEGRVFWDGRGDFYGTPYNQAALDTAMGKPAWRETLDRNRIDAALVPVELPLAAILEESTEWRALYRDAAVALYVRSKSEKRQ